MCTDSWRQDLPTSLCSIKFANTYKEIECIDKMCATCIHNIHVSCSIWMQQIHICMLRDTCSMADPRACSSVSPSKHLSKHKMPKADTKAIFTHKHAHAAKPLHQEIWGRWKWDLRVQQSMMVLATCTHHHCQISSRSCCCPRLLATKNKHQKHCLAKSRRGLLW